MRDMDESGGWNDGSMLVCAKRDGPVKACRFLLLLPLALTSSYRANCALQNAGVYTVELLQTSRIASSYTNFPPFFVLFLDLHGG